MLRLLHTEEFTVIATAATEGAFNYPPFLSAMILFRSLGGDVQLYFLFTTSNTKTFLTSDSHPWLAQSSQTYADRSQFVHSWLDTCCSQNKL